MGIGLEIGNNRNCWKIEEKAREMLGFANPPSNSLKGIDGYKYGENGKISQILEVKDFSKNYPSLSSVSALKKSKDILEVVTKCCVADVFAFYLGKSYQYEPEKWLIMGKLEAIEWIYKRVRLSQASSSKNCQDILRIGKLPRTAEKTAEFVKKDYLLR